MAKVEFTKEAGKYYVEIKDRNLISATVTLSAEWDHDDESYGDPVGKIVIKGSDNQRKENSIPCLISSSTLSTSAILSLAVTFDLVLNGTCFSVNLPSINQITLAYHSPLRFLSDAITDSCS